MQFLQTSLIALLVGFVAAQGSSVCFDDADCFFAGGKCAKASGQILGSCSGSTTLSTVATPVATAPAASATGSVCFDDGDCILSGGHCVKDPSNLGGLLGNCFKS